MALTELGLITQICLMRKSLLSDFSLQCYLNSDVFCLRILHWVSNEPLEHIILKKCAYSRQLDK